MLEARLDHIEKTKTLEVMELQAEVADLIKHLEVQAAVGNAEQGIKDVRSNYVDLKIHCFCG